MPNNKIEIRTEEINEILGKSPNKIISYGITVIFIVIMSILAGSWYFKYPDFIISSIEITTKIPPAEIVSKASGKIEYFLVNDNDYVQKGDYLAIIENPANYYHVKNLLLLMDSLKENPSEMYRVFKNDLKNPKKYFQDQTSFIKSSPNIHNHTIVIFRVQIAASIKNINNDKDLDGLDKVYTYRHNGLYKFCVGEEKDYKDALALKNHLRTTQFKDAFIVAFKNGERISLEDAQELSINNNSQKKAKIKSHESILDYSLSSEELVLGENQAYLSDFSKKNNQLINFKQINYHDKKINAISKQIEGQKKYKLLLESQIQTLIKELELAEVEHQRYQNLFIQKIIAESELDKIHGSLLQKQYTVESAVSNLVNIDNQITLLENNILELQLQKQQQLIELENNLKESFDILFNQLKTWELRYVLKAPINGTCSFNKYWIINQNVAIGDKVLTIIPKTEQNIIGKLLLSVQGSGKAKIGQKVNIKLLNYPYMEYGMLQGVINTISLVPYENFYSVEVGFDDGMKTNYGKILTFQQKMQGTAEIITEDIRLIERILMPIRSLIKNRSFKKINTPIQESSQKR